MIYAGIDMAKKKFDYCIIDSELSVIKRGNPLIRYALCLSTASAIRFNPVIKRYYTRKNNDGISY